MPSRALKKRDKKNRARDKIFTQPSKYFSILKILQYDYALLSLHTLLLYQSLCSKNPETTSAKRWPASDTVVLHPDSTSLDSASCTSCASCAHAPHLVASGASRDPCRHWVLSPSGHMPLSNPASHAS